MKSSRAGRWPVLWLAVACSLYAAVGFAQLHLPGLYYDEALDAVPALQVLQGMTPSTVATIDVLGRPLPLMLMQHIGPTSTAVSAAGLAVLGVSVEALRATFLVVGIVTLLLLWRLARRWFGDAVASVTVLLCATAPAFIWWNRAGANWSSPLLPIALLMMLALDRWWRSRRTAWLMLAAFLFGVGFVTKILFIWLLAPLGLTALIALGPRGLLRATRELRLTGWLAVTGALLLGLLPFIVYNLPDGATFRWILANVGRTSLYGHDNLDFARNLRMVGVEFLRMIGGDVIAMPTPRISPLSIAVFIAALAYNTVALARHRPLRDGSARWFLVLSVVTVLPISTVSTTTIGAKYLFVIVPFVWMLVAVAIVEVCRALALRRAAFRHAIALATAALMTWHLATNVALHVDIARSGGRWLWSDAIYRLTDDLTGRFTGRPAIAMDWGFRRSVEFLTGARLSMREMYDYAPEQSGQFADAYAALLREPDNLYVFHAPAVTAFGGVATVFERETLKRRLTLVQQAEYRERTGAPNTVVYSAEPAPRSFVVSPTLAGRDAVIGGATLLGGAVRFDPARNEVGAVLQWRADRGGLPDDTVLVHIVDQSDGHVVAVGDVQPVYGSYRMPEWQQGEVVIDPHWITLPPDVPPGTYQVRIGLYDAATGARRAIADPKNDAAGDSLMLGTFSIGPR